MPSRAIREGSKAGPIGNAEFATLMDRLGIFEPGQAPGQAIAAAVSGGPDSMALVILAARWLNRFDGATAGGNGAGPRLVALTVDHGLRRESAAEARQVSRWCRERGIEPHILVWKGKKPGRGIRAAAREARYGLLKSWCLEHGIHHLLLAHHLEDQAETFMLRLARGSGVDGLSAMAPISGEGKPRLCRPLLAVPRERLRATLLDAGQDWIEDPSNADPAFARVRMRGVMARLAAEGLTPGRLAATAHRMMRARQALETATDELIGKCARVDAAGYARLNAATLVAAPEEIAFRALALLVMIIGGAGYRPRLARLERLHKALAEENIGRGRTLAGCVIRPCPRRLVADGGNIVICREPSAVAPPLALEPGRELCWDRRFMVRVEAAEAAGSIRVAKVAALGGDGWTAIRERVDAKLGNSLPAAARATLPALWSRGRVVAAPHLGFLDDTLRNRIGRFDARLLQPGMSCWGQESVV